LTQHGDKMVTDLGRSLQGAPLSDSWVLVTLLRCVFGWMRAVGAAKCESYSLTCKFRADPGLSVENVRRCPDVTRGQLPSG
jgi:hypothetical protein